MNHKPRTVAIIQARMTSSRLPGKSLMDLAGKPLVVRVVERMQWATSLDAVVLATSTNKYDDIIEIAVSKIGIPIFRGSLEDVLDRFHGATMMSEAELIVRITADNPLTEPRFIDRGVEVILREKADYLCPANMPYWTGVQIFTRHALERAWRETNDPYDREHVCPYFEKDGTGFRSIVLENNIPGTQRPEVRLSLDTMEDYYKFYHIYEHFTGVENIKLEDAIKFLDENDL